MSNRNAYPSDARDEEGAFVAPYLTLLPVTAGQTEHSLREVFNGLRWVVRTGSPWRDMPHDLPPWAAVYQQMQRWMRAGVFEPIVHDLRSLLRVLQGCSRAALGLGPGQPNPALDARERNSGGQ